MKKKVMTAVLMMSMIIGSSLTVCAAPEMMADGVVFDPEYYARTNPDVEAALGMDADALYQHYVNFGRAEGRLRYDGEILLPAEMVASTSQMSAQQSSETMGEVQPNGDVIMPNGEIIRPNGDVIMPSGQVIPPSVKVWPPVLRDGVWESPDGVWGVNPNTGEYYKSGDIMSDGKSIFAGVFDSSYGW